VNDSVDFVRKMDFVNKLLPIVIKIDPYNFVL